MSLKTVLNGGFQTYEYQKFVEIINDTNFPPVTAYWNNDLSSKTQVFPKTAVLTYDISRSQTNSLPFGDNGAIDAFGRLRVSTPTAVFSVKQLNSSRPIIFDTVTNGSGTYTFSEADAATILSTSSNGDYVIRQSKQSFNYQPGKSQQYLFTGLLSGGEDVDMIYGFYRSNTSAPYNERTGFFFRNNNDVLSVNIGNPNGTVSSLYVPQSAWNIDTLDGNGASGITLDMTKVQIFTVDYEWLGVGRVRFGFVIDGAYYYCHQVLNANNIESVYLNNPNLPLRAELRQNGTTSANMLHICATVNSEGGVQKQGTRRSVDTMDYTGINEEISIGVGVEASILQLALTGTRLQGVISPETINVMNTDSNIDTRVRLIAGPAHTGSVSLTSINSSSASWGVGSSAVRYISGGNILSTYYISKDAASANNTIKDSFYSLGSLINGTPEVLHVFVTPLKSGGGGSGLYFASADWLENE